jgi:hypothetical protein
MAKKAPPTLADRIYEATHRGDIPWMHQPLLLRQKLFQAKRFVMDERMSAFMADLATAAFIPKNLQTKVLADGRSSWLARPGSYKLAEQMRIGARLPHAVTWVEYNLFAERCRYHQLIKSALAPSRDEVPMLEGWLFEQHPTDDTTFRASLFNSSDKDGSVFMFPFTYQWTTGDIGFENDSEGRISEVALGLPGYRTNRVGATWSPYVTYDMRRGKEEKIFDELFNEWGGTLRRMWAFLSTINDIPVLAREIKASRGFMARGSYKRFLDHKTITLTVPIERELRTLARSIVAMARRRAHQVRGHWRVDWRQPPSKLCDHEWSTDNLCKICKGHRLWIHEYERGDPSLGVVMTDYKVEHPNR